MDQERERVEKNEVETRVDGDGIEISAGHELSALKISIQPKSRDFFSRKFQYEGMDPQKSERITRVRSLRPN